MVQSDISDAPNLAPSQERRGMAMVFLSALFWSLGGTIERFLHAPDVWTIVFWRSFWAAVFLLGFLLWRDGAAGTWRLFRGMGRPGLAVAICFGISSASFVISIQYTTVANVLLIQASVPLLAALMSFIVFGERVSGPTWAAIGAVLVGVGVMVSESATGKVSPVGDGLAVLIAVCFAIATVITRRYANVRMTPANCLAAALAAIVASTQASTLAVSQPDFIWLIVFGMLNLGLGFALFATGARLIPAPLAALLGTFEPILGPIWVWLVHGEIPSARTLLGGGMVMVALFAYLAREFSLRSSRRPA